MAMRTPNQPSWSSLANLDINRNVTSGTQASFDNAATQSGRPIPKEFDNAGSPSTDAEALLRALRNVIIPFVRSPNTEKKHDTNQNILGPEGEEFVIALQKFMSSFLRSQRSPAGVEVGLKEKESHISNAGSRASNISHDDSKPKDVADMPPFANPPPDRLALEENTRSQNTLESIEVLHEESLDESELSVRGSISVKDTDPFEQRRSRFVEDALNALREHVFNVMPIRLLYFKPHASKLQITLVERGAIYADIAPTLKADIRNLDSFPPNLVDDVGYRETDEEVIARLICQCLGYAILSHTWLRGVSSEVTYSDWNRGEFNAQKPGYQKLVNFCKAAWEDYGVSFGWMDTICINKESSAELDESIRSMYKWYRNADVCITYLAETVTVSDVHNDSWFTRGWTLQELIAPRFMKFYNTNWNKLVESSTTDKEIPVIQKQIEQATTITASELTWLITTLPISRRMELAAKRQVTREEDSAYCLMGIFDISISIAYGEGAQRVFSRILLELLNLPVGVPDIFNWAGFYSMAHSSSLLPPTLQSYLRRSSHQHLHLWKTPIEPLMVTHLGLRITIVLMSAISISNPTSRYDPIGDYHAFADISPLTDYLVAVNEMVGGSYSVLDARISGVELDGWKEEHNWYQLTFGILNVGIGDTDSTIFIPKHCLAVGLQYYMGRGAKIPTETPIVFTLNKTHSPIGEPIDYSASNNSYIIERSELESHGIKLVMMYL